MKRIELLNLSTSLSQFTNDDTYPKEFALCIFRNNQILKPIIEAFRAQAPKKNANINDYETKKNEIVQKYGIKDKDGIVIQTTLANGNTFVKISQEFKTVCDNEMLALNSEYKADLDMFDSQLREFDEFMNKENDEEITLKKIDVKELPDKVSVNMLENLTLILKE